MSPSQDRNSGWGFQPLLNSVAVVVGVLAVLVATLPDGRVTRAGFASIRMGMSRDELHDLLGRAPDFQAMGLGKVNGPDNYAANFGGDPKELRRKGYQEYRREHWISAEVTITVITNLKGQVVCRYSSGGQSRLRDFWNWLSALFKTAPTSAPSFQIRDRTHIISEEEESNSWQSGSMLPHCWRTRRLASRKEIWW